MKKKLSKPYYKFLLEELNSQKDRGLITKQQLDDMMTFYEEEEHINFIKILVTVGAILIGLGILTFVASNWIYISKVFKVIIIESVIGFSIFAAFKLEKEYSKTSKALLYLSVLAYGAGIFLIGQTFNYGGEFTEAFLLWSIGALAVGLILKEEIIFIFSHFLFLVYINGSFNDNIIILALVITAIFYAGNKYFNYSRVITFFNNLIALNFGLYFFNYIDLNSLYIALIFFLLGLSMYYIKHKLNLDIFKLQGLIVSGISGLFLTSKHLWENLSFINNGNFAAISFAVILLLYLLVLVKKGLLIPLIFICALILRYYFDTLYDFMPKSLFFVIGGVILLGFGYYFEKLRKKPGGILNEKDS